MLWVFRTPWWNTLHFSVPNVLTGLNYSFSPDKQCKLVKTSSLVYENMFIFYSEASPTFVN